MKKKPQIKASIALTTVIIVSAILLSGGITLVLVSIDLALARQGHSATTEGRFHSVSCLEEVLKRLSEDSSFEGNVSIAPVEENCTATVSNDPGDSSIKLVEITSVVESYSTLLTRKIQTFPESAPILIE